MKLLRKNIIVVILIFFSKILGFIRDVMLAHFFAGTEALGSFIIAFKIPNFIRRLFADGAFSQSLYPIVFKKKKELSKTDFQAYLQSSASIVFIISILFYCIAILSSKFLVIIFAPGFIGNTFIFNQTNSILEIVLIYIPFIIMTAFLGAILNCYKRIIPPVIAPVIFNTTLIYFIFFSYDFNIKIYSVAYGVAIAGFLQFIFLFLFVKKQKLWKLKIPKVHILKLVTFLKNISYSLIAASTVPISLIIETIFTSFLKKGSLSWLYFADRINQLIYGVFSVIIVTVILPLLIKNNSIKTIYSKTVDICTKWILFLAMPIVILITMLSHNIIFTLFYNGRFTLLDANNTSNALIIFAIAFYPFVIAKLFACIHHASNNFKTPFKYSVISLLVQVIINTIIVSYLRESDNAFLFLASSTSFCACLNAFLLWTKIKKSKSIYGYKNKTQRIFIYKIVIALAIMFISLFFMKDFYTNIAHYPSLQNFIYLSTKAFISILIYMMSLAFLGVRKRDFII